MAVEQKEKVLQNFTIPVSLQERLKNHLKKNGGLKINWAICQAISEWLDKVEQDEQQTAKI